MKKKRLLITAVVLAALLVGSSSGFAAGVWTTYNKANTDNGIPNNSIRAIEFIGDVAWVATNGGGITKFDGTNWTVYKTTEGLVHNYAWDIDIDSSGNLWIATNGGVSKFDGTNFTNYTTTTSNLNDNNCRSIEVDTDGSTIWIATIGGGINKFDGTNWTEYKTTNSDLPHNSAWGLDIDSSGNKWFATLGGAAKFDGTNWDVYTTELVHDDVYNVRIDDNGDVWFATIRGVNKFDGTNWTTYEEENGMAEENARDLRYDPNSGLLWVGTISVGGAHLYDGTTWTQYKTQTCDIINNYVWVVTIESSAKVWFGTSGGISVYDITPAADFSAWPVDGIAPMTVDFTDDSTGEITSWSWTFGDGGTSTAQNPSHQYASAGDYTVGLTVTGPVGSDNETKTDLVSVSPAGTLVCDFSGWPTRGDTPLIVSFTDQSTGGINSWTWDFGDGSTSTEQNPSHTYNDTGSYDVSLTISGAPGSDGKTRNDYIGVIEPNSIAAWTTYTKLSTDNGLPSNVVKAILPDGNDVWIGTSGGGMTKYDGSDWTVYKTTEGLVNNYVWDLAIDDADILWVATNGGLSKFDGTSFTNYTTSNSDLSDNNLRALTVDSDGVNLWIGSIGGGVDKFDGTNFTNYNTANSNLPHDKVWGSAMDSAGSLWFTTMGGVARYDGTNWTAYTTELVHDDVYDVAVDVNNNAWFATIKGVSKFDGTAWTTYEQENGMPDENCRAIAADENGIVWVGTVGSGGGSGVCELDVDANEWTQYLPENSGLVNKYVWAIAIQTPLKVWFGSNGGLNLMEIGAGGVPSAPAAPTNPSPADDANNVSRTVTLSWTPDPNATSHDVYFGTNSVPDANQFQQNQSGSAFAPGTLDYQTTYYWRIDSKNDIGTTTGTVWSFTTVAPPPAPAKATDPNPANSATDVSITANLSWTADVNATSHDVYFGTNSTPDANDFQLNQPGATFDPGTMNYGTTYYWRIDSKNVGGTTTGDVWSFTTGTPPAKATNPYPYDTAANISIHANLSWTPGYNATSQDVYFGSSSPPGFAQTLSGSATSHDPGELELETVYYWRVDTNNTSETVTGDLWSFTTAANEGLLFEDSNNDLGNTHPHLFMHGYGTDNGWWDKVSSDSNYTPIWNRVTGDTGTTQRFEIINSAFAYTISKQDTYGSKCKTTVTSLTIPPGKETDYKRCIGPAAYAVAFDAIADGVDSQDTPWLTAQQRADALDLIADTLIDLGGTNGNNMYGDWEYKPTHNFFQSAFSNMAACAYVLRGESGYETLAASSIEAVKTYHNYRTNGLCRDAEDWALWEGPLTGDGYPPEGPQYGGYLFPRGGLGRHIIEMNEYPNYETILDENLSGYFQNYNFGWMALAPQGLGTWVKISKCCSPHGGYAGFRFCAAVNWAAGRQTEARVAEWFCQQAMNMSVTDYQKTPSLELLWYNPEITPLSPDDAGMPLYQHLDDSELHVYRDSWDITGASNGDTYVYFRNSPHDGHNYWDEGHSEGGQTSCTAQTSSHESSDNGHFCIYKKGTGYIMDYGAAEGDTDENNCLQVDSSNQRMPGGPGQSQRAFNHPEYANIDVVGAVDSDYGHALDAIVGPAYSDLDELDLDAYRRYFFVIRDPMYVLVVDDLESGHSAKFHGYNASSSAHYEMLYPDGASLSGSRPMTCTTSSAQLMFLCHPSPSGVSISKSYSSGDVIADIGDDTVIYNPDGSSFNHSGISGDAVLFAERSGGALVFKATSATGSQYGLSCNNATNMSVSGNKASIYVYGTGSHTVTVSSPYGVDVFSIQAGQTVEKVLTGS